MRLDVLCLGMACDNVMNPHQVNQNVNQKVGLLQQQVSSLQQEIVGLRSQLRQQPPPPAAADQYELLCPTDCSDRLPNLACNTNNAVLQVTNRSVIIN